MRGDILTQGQCCGINGCQRVTIEHLGGGDSQAFVVPKDNDGIRVDAAIVNDKPIFVAYNAFNPNNLATINHKDFNGVKADFSLMCMTSQATWEYLLVEEGTIMLIDGQCVIVKRKNEND